MIKFILTALLQAPWRRYRRNLLSVTEMATLPDLTLAEFNLVLATQERANLVESSKRTKTLRSL